MKKRLVATMILSVMLCHTAYCEEQSNASGLSKSISLFSQRIYPFISNSVLSKELFLSLKPKSSDDLHTSDNFVDKILRPSFKNEDPEFQKVFIKKYHFYLEKVSKESFINNLKDIVWTDLEKEAREDAKTDLANFFERLISEIRSQNEQIGYKNQYQNNNFLETSQCIINVVEEYEKKILEIDKQIYAFKMYQKTGKKINIPVGSRVFALRAGNVFGELLNIFSKYSWQELKIAKDLMDYYSKEYKNGYAQWNCKIDNEKKKLEEKTKQLDSYKYIDKSALNEITNKMQECIEDYRQKSLELAQITKQFEGGLNIDLQELMILTESQLQEFNEQYSPSTYSKDIRNIVIIEEKKYIELALEVKRNHDNIEKLRKFAVDTPEYLKLLDEEFENETSLSKNDYLLMSLAVVLQVARQNLVLLIPSINNQKSDKVVNDALGMPKTSSNRNYGYYNPSFEQVLINPVPYDVNINSQGRLVGHGEGGHRAATLGHDSLLGLIVGTANIATGTVTLSDLNSYHVTTSNKKDAFGNKASTEKVFGHFVGKFISKDVEDKKILGVAFAKQLVHMATDLSTKNSLPLPFVGLCDGLSKRWGNNPVGLGKKLSSIGLNTSRLVVSAGGAIAINCLVEWLYYALCYDESMIEDLFMVKSNKIVAYSNLIASAVNIGEAVVLENPKLVDLGGYLVAVAKFVTSVEFERKVKKDFIFGKYDKALAEL